MSLKEFFIKNPKAAIAFSGGVDSAYLLYMANKYAKDIGPYYVKSAFQPEFELEDAKKLAASLEIGLKIIDLDIFEHKNVYSNKADRCYHCKKAIFMALKNAAEKDGYNLILDGTNASDKYEDRPGMKALGELSVRSPLRECKITKDEIRKHSKELGLFTWNKPAYSCLATRIKTNQEISESLLKKIEAAEGELFGHGFSDFRLRVLGSAAKIEIDSKELPLLLEKRKVIIDEIRPFFEDVLLDLRFRDEQ